MSAVAEERRGTRTENSHLDGRMNEMIDGLAVGRKEGESRCG